MKTTGFRFAAGLLFSFALLAASPRAHAQSAGAKTFKANCVLCHGADASGNTPAGKVFGAKNLRSPEVQRKSDAEITTIITKGEGKMPAFGKKLSPDDIKGLVAYIREIGKKK